MCSVLNGLMRIGEILVKHGWVYEEDVDNALADQKVVGRRLCSMLILRGHLEPDQAARALAEQHDVSAALTKHLENRERPLARLMPTNLARQYGVLVLGRMRGGEIVVAVRDPKPELGPMFERVLAMPVLVTVAAACQLDPLIDMAYPPTAQGFPRPASEPVANRPPEPMSFAAGTFSVGGGEDDSIDIDLEADLDAGLPPDEDHGLQLVDLDDVGVSKQEFSTVDMKTPVPLPPAGAPPRQSTLPPSNVPKATGTTLPPANARTNTKK